VSDNNNDVEEPETEPTLVEPSAPETSKRERIVDADEEGQEEVHEASSTASPKRKRGSHDSDDFNKVDISEYEGESDEEDGSDGDENMENASLLAHVKRRGQSTSFCAHTTC
jgi:hypothetical protein